MKKNFKKIAFTMLSILCICIVGTTLAGCKKKPFELSTTIEQIDNSQAIKVSWDSDRIIDEVTIVLKHGNDVEKTITINDFDGQTTNDAIRGEKENSITIDTFYGRHTVEITATLLYGQCTCQLYRTQYSPLYQPELCGSWYAQKCKV